MKEDRDSSDYALRRRLTLALTAASLLCALGVLAVVLRGDESQPPPSVQASAASTPGPQALGELLTALPDSAISEEGSYMADLQTGEIWETDRFALWSPDGTKLLRALCCGDGESGLDVLELSTLTAVRIFHQQVGSVAWSPDSLEIAFSRFTGSSSEGIYVVSADGSDLRQPVELESAGALSWSPSGDYLASLGPPSGGPATLVSLATGESKIIADNVTDLAWSPRANTLAYGSPNGLVVLDADSGETRSLASLPTSSNIRWSPDGTYLLASLDGVDHVLPLDRAGKTTPLPPGRFFTWSPDATRIAYMNEGCSTGDWNVYVLAVAGGTKTKLTQTPATSKEGLSWSRDNRSVVFSTGSQLIVVDSESGEEAVTASVTSEAAGYLHYHVGFRGLRGPGPSVADGRYVMLGAWRSGHGLCD